jgi:hypothetical protein
VLIFRVITSILFFSSLNLVILSLIIASITLWIRATLPIIRYDQLIYMAWKCFLPISIAFISYSILFLCLELTFQLQTETPKNFCQDFVFECFLHVKLWPLKKW